MHPTWDGGGARVGAAQGSVGMYARRIDRGLMLLLMDVYSWSVVTTD